MLNSSKMSSPKTEKGELYYDLKKQPLALKLENQRYISIRAGQIRGALENVATKIEHQELSHNL